MFHRIEQKWMCQSHGILQLPRSLFRSIVFPLHLYLHYGLVPEHCDLPVEDAHWLDSEISLGFHLITSQFITWLGSCTYLLSKETWKTLWDLVLAGNASLYATGPILRRTSNDPHYLGNNLAQLPNLQWTFLCLHSEVNMIPNIELSVYPMLI